MDLKLQDQVAIVTGGSRGLGRAICLALAAEGARVGVNYRRGADAAAAVVDEIHATRGAKALPLAGDVTVAADVGRMFDRVEAELGPVGVLVNNAGLWPTALVHEMAETQWNKTIAVNLNGPFLTCREAVRRWIETDREGRIVNVVSPAAFRGSTTGHADYAAAKAGLVSLTVSLAREVAPRGIAVNAVAPGMMETDMARDTLQKNLEHYIKRIPLGRIGDAAEVAAVVAFLASAKASYMTGATVDVSGGMLMR